MKNIDNTDYIDKIEYSWYWDLTNRECEIEYFKMKQKHGYSFDKIEKERFLKDVLNKVIQSQDFVGAQAIVLAQTDNELLKEIAEGTGLPVYYLKKNSAPSIMESVGEQNMMKSERAKLMRDLESMPVVKMAALASNQRARLVNCLFEEIDSSLNGKKVVFLEDSVFSGMTLRAVEDKLKSIEHKNLVLFKKR